MDSLEAAIVVLGLAGALGIAFILGVVFGKWANKFRPKRDSKGRFSK